MMLKYLELWLRENAVDIVLAISCVLVTLALVALVLVGWLS